MEPSNSTPIKNSNVKRTPTIMFSQSTRKTSKVFIDRNGHAHREDFTVAHQAPMLLVPIISNRHNPEVACEEIQEELKRVKE